MKTSQKFHTLTGLLLWVACAILALYGCARPAFSQVLPTAATEAVTKTKASGDAGELTVGFRVPSARTVTFASGATLDVTAATLLLPAELFADTFQPLNTNLTAFAGLTSAADRLPYFTGAGTADLAVFTANGRKLVSLAGSFSNVFPYFDGSGNATVATITSLGRSLLDDTTQGLMHSTLGLVPGTHVQAWDADLDAWALVNPSSYLTAAQVASGYVSLVALSTWAGSSSITTLGNITTGSVPAANVSGLAAVATSGQYSDLSGTPTLGSAAAAATTDFATSAQGTVADSAVQPGDLADVAFSGSYDDLLDKPSLAVVATSGAYSDLSGRPDLPNTFSTISVSGQDNVVADSTADTLTLVAGSNITITTNASSDSITIAAAAGEGVDWGAIGGDLTEQTDLQAALDDKLDTDGNGSGLTGLTWGQLGGTPTTLGGYGITDAVPSNRTLTAGTGIATIGDLSANRTIALSSAAIASLALADSAVQPGSLGTMAYETAANYLTTSAAASTYQPLDAALTALAAGSDFVQFTGPAGTVKVFTLPNASSTILTDNTPVTPTHGGTGLNNSALAADRYLYTSATGTFTSGTITAFGRSLLDAADAVAGRTTLGATTVGTNLFTLANPSAVRFIRVNADNTVTARSDSDFRTDIGLGTGDSPVFNDLALAAGLIVNGPAGIGANRIRLTGYGGDANRGIIVFNASDFDNYIFFEGAGLYTRIAGADRTTVTASGLSVNGRVASISSTTSQGLFTGWNSKSGANSENGEIRLGGDAAGTRVMADGASSGGTVIEDLWDNPSSSILFRLRGYGTPLNGMLLTTTGLSVTAALGATGNVWGQSSNVDVTTGSADGFTFYSADSTFHFSRNAGSVFVRRRTSDGNSMAFYRDTTQVGSISVTTTATAYNTASDERLKTNIREVDHAQVRAIIEAIAIRDYDWRATGAAGIGPIAQELAATHPMLVKLGVVTPGDNQAVDYAAWRARKARVDARADRNAEKLAAHKTALEAHGLEVQSIRAANEEAVETSPVGAQVVPVTYSLAKTVVLKLPPPPPEPILETHPEDEEQDFDQWQVDFSKLVPLLLDYAQQESRRLDALDARVAALESLQPVGR